MVHMWHMHAEIAIQNSPLHPTFYSNRKVVLSASYTLEVQIDIPQEIIASVSYTSCTTGSDKIMLHYVLHPLT